jgi:hypothetical protein
MQNDKLRKIYASTRAQGQGSMPHDTNGRVPLVSSSSSGRRSVPLTTHVDASLSERSGKSAGLDHRIHSPRYQEGLRQDGVGPKGPEIHPFAAHESPPLRYYGSPPPPPDASVSDDPRRPVHSGGMHSPRTPGSHPSPRSRTALLGVNGPPSSPGVPSGAREGRLCPARKQPSENGSLCGSASQGTVSPRPLSRTGEAETAAVTMPVPARAAASPKRDFTDRIQPPLAVSPRLYKQSSVSTGAWDGERLGGDANGARSAEGHHQVVHAHAQAQTHAPGGRSPLNTGGSHGEGEDQFDEEAAPPPQRRRTNPPAFLTMSNPGLEGGPSAMSASQGFQLEGEMMLQHQDSEASGSLMRDEERKGWRPCNARDLVTDDVAEREAAQREAAQWQADAKHELLTIHLGLSAIKCAHCNPSEGRPAYILFRCLTGLDGALTLKYPIVQCMGLMIL